MLSLPQSKKHLQLNILSLFIILDLCHYNARGSKCIWQVMNLDATEATMHNLSSDIIRNCYTSRQMERQYFRGKETPASSTSNRKQLPLNGGSDFGFIMLSTWPLSTWNTQVLWLLQPPWHELSIRVFESNSLARLCHLYFHNCLEFWFWGALRVWSVLPRLTTSLVSRDEEICSPCQIMHVHSIMSKNVDTKQTPLQ